MTPDQIIAHCREECRRYAIASGNDFPEHEADAIAEKLLVSDLASKLANAMVCAELASAYFDERFRARAEKQLWNW